MAAILIGGTPGTGKTKISKIVGSKISVEVVSLGDLARDADCVKRRDFARDTDIIDEDCLVDAILELTEEKKGKIVIEGHYIDLVPFSYVDHVFVLRTHPHELRERLRERDYSEEKIVENVEAEVIGVCQLDALDSFGEDKVREIDTTGLTPAKTADVILSELKKPSTKKRIDWMEALEKEGRLDEFLK